MHEIALLFNLQSRPTQPGHPHPRLDALSTSDRHNDCCLLACLLSDLFMLEHCYWW